MIIMTRTSTAVFALSLSFALTSVAACKSEIDDKPKAKVEAAEKTDAAAKAPEAGAAQATTLALAKDGTTIAFIGAKVTGDHRGTFADFEGSATVEGDKLTGMEISVDVASMVIEPQGLKDHLENADFFDAPTHPKAKFTVLSVTEKPGEDGTTHEIAGNLELKGEAKKVTFPAVVHVKDGSVHGKAAFSIDRKLWGITYPGKPDDLIKDEVALELDLNFPKA